MTTLPLVPEATLRLPAGLRPLRGPAAKALPGLALVAGGVAVATGVSRLVPSVSPLVVAVVAGAVLTNVGLVPNACRPGTELAARRLLRIGIVLLGLQLAVGDVLRLGAPRLAVVAVVVAATFLGTRWLGSRLGVDPGLSLLIATGFSICGASAVAAMKGVSDADEDDVAFSIGLVTLCGSLAILLLPLVRRPLGLDDGAFGAWVGASVHDVAQVVATAASGGAAALQAAVVVKLTRVVLLAPMVSAVTVRRRRRSDPGVAVEGARRPPLVPLFVAGFLGAVVLRSTGLLPGGVLDGLRTAETLVLAAALFGLGTGVRLARLRRLGGRPLLLGLAAWVLVASVSYVGIRLVGAG
ncbi:MAG TPA: putative sulfate exporter family transporter [Acidimicrobiales bacterium]